MPQSASDWINQTPWKVDVQDRLRRVDADIERAISIKSWRLNKPGQEPGHEHWILPLKNDAERTPLMDEAEAVVKATYCYIAKTSECLPPPARWWQRLRERLGGGLLMSAYTSLHAAETNRVLLLSSDQLAAILPTIRERASAYLPTLVKLAFGAITAMLGIIILSTQSSVGVLGSQAGLLTTAVVFGYSQQLFTRLIDQQANDLVTAASSTTKAGGAGSP
jgi:hypothetical protein